jgi:hypothetical protein
MAVINQDFTVWQGTTLSINVTVTDEAGSPKDISGWSGSWAMWDDFGVRVLKTVGDGITIVSPTNGNINISVEVEDIKNLLGNYKHECRMVDTTSQEDVVLTGQITVERSKSRV